VIIDNIYSVVDEMIKTANKNNILELHALELFCGDGKHYSAKFSKYCKSFTGCDIDEQNESMFYKNIPCGEFIEGDSVVMVKTSYFTKLDKNFNIISMDAPLCIFGNSYCEHFDIITQMKRLITTKCIIAFNIVMQPYTPSGGMNPKWIERRNKFYNTNDSLNLDLDYVFHFYCELFKSQDIIVHEMHIMPRAKKDKIDFLYFAFCVCET